MPSQNKTPNYNLNQWEGTEYPLRTDFNDDNAKIDAALGRINQNLDKMAQFKNGTGTFPASATSYQVDDAFITASTFVTIAPTSAKENFWDVDSYDGYFIITSKDGGTTEAEIAEPVDVTFHWSAMKGGA